MLTMIAVAMIFGFVAFMGLLAAKRPELFARYFLAEWQRRNLAGNMAALSWTGWVLFGCGAFSAVMILIASVLR
jgi:hypothetical protein